MEEKYQKTNYKVLILTGMISLAAAVGGSLLVERLTEEKLSLSYEMTASETFGSANGNIRITNIEVNNQGSKSVDDIVLSLSLQDGSIDEFKVNGIPANSYVVDKKKNKLIFSSKYINPEELFSVQLLLKNSQTTDFLPSIDLRGRGVIGKQAVKEEKNSIFASIGIALAAISIFMAFLSSRKTSSKILDVTGLSKSLSDIEDSHHGEQRDIVAYILGINGLQKEADEVRFIKRDISYWSISDHLVEKWIESRDSERMTKGAESLNELIGYAGIREDSVRLIKTGIARLYSELGNIVAVEKITNELASDESQVIKQRLNKASLLENA